MTRRPKEERENRIRRPNASSKAALSRMKAAKPRDTAPEKAIRSALHRLGLRYSIDVKPVEELNRRADILFRSFKRQYLLMDAFGMAVLFMELRLKQMQNSGVQRSAEIKNVMHRLPST
jgi:hypothetical protein